MQLRPHLAQGLVSREEHAWNPIPSGHPTVDQELRGGLPVDGDAVNHAAVDGVAQGVASLPRRIVIAHEKGGIEAAVQPFHHHLR